MKYAPILALALVASNGFAVGHELTLGVGTSDFSSKASIDGVETNSKDKLQTAFLSYTPTSDNFGLGIKLGAGVSDDNLSTRSLRLVPQYKVLDLGIWALAGIGYQDLRQSSVNHSVTTGLVGVAFKPKTGVENLGLNFELLYEKSIAADDFKVNGTSVSKYSLENIEASLGFTYSL